MGGGRWAVGRWAGGGLLQGSGVRQGSAAVKLLQPPFVLDTCVAPHSAPHCTPPRCSCYDGKLKCGILPVSIFCSGHTGFTQGMPDKLGKTPYVVHATFQYSGTPGKRHRMREKRWWRVRALLALHWWWMGGGGGAAGRWDVGVLVWIAGRGCSTPGTAARRSCCSSLPCLVPTPYTHALMPPRAHMLATQNLSHLSAAGGRPRLFPAPRGLPRV